MATGAVANWLAGVVAQQTTESQISDTAIAAYQHFFSQMGEWTLGCVAVIVIVAFARDLQHRPAARPGTLTQQPSDQEVDILAGAEANDKKKYR